MMLIIFKLDLVERCDHDCQYCLILHVRLWISCHWPAEKINNKKKNNKTISILIKLFLDQGSVTPGLAIMLQQSSRVLRWLWSNQQLKILRKLFNYLNRLIHLINFKVRMRNHHWKYFSWQNLTINDNLCQILSSNNLCHHLFERLGPALRQKSTALTSTLRWKLCLAKIISTEN